MGFPFWGMWARGYERMRDSVAGAGWGWCLEESKREGSGWERVASPHHPTFKKQLWERRSTHSGGGGFPGGSVVKSPCQDKRHGFDPWVGKIPWSRKWQPAPVFLPEEFHGQRSLVACNPWGCKDTTEHTQWRSLVHRAQPERRVPSFLLVEGSLATLWLLLLWAWLLTFPRSQGLVPSP